MTPGSIIIPVKSPAKAKSRLSGLLSPEARVDFAMAIAGDLAREALAACRVPGSPFQTVTILTNDASVAAWACGLGASALLDRPGLDLSANLERAIEECRALGAGDCLILAADLPYVKDADIVRLGQSSPGPLTICRARRDFGTTALLLRRGCLLPLAFGQPRSASVHAAMARSRSLAVTLEADAPFDVDIDLSDDLLAMDAARTGPALGHFLSVQGLALIPPLKEAQFA